ncbi:nucleotide modification associated domain-containing protein [Niallia taxi]|uniref:nucleotide modification associated domain-containing protein n=1 Tax=Niallia taxi TaxID=2499688 RepID=UPI00316EEF73
MSAELHKNILDEIHHTYKIKNADYGNSFGEQFEEHGMLSAIIRLDDKMRRLKSLNKQEAQVKDESIRDTVLDLANYAIMTVMELDKVNK